MAVLGEKGVNVKFWFCDPKRHNLAQNRVFWHRPILRQCPYLRGGWMNNRKNSRVNKVREVAHARKQKHYPIWIKFCKMVDISGLITCANFGDDRLRGSGVAGIKLSPSSLTLIVALTTLSHYRASVWRYGTVVCPVCLSVCLYHWCIVAKQLDGSRCYLIRR